MNHNAFYGLPENFFEGKVCDYTASEIAGQPMLWHELGKSLLARKQDISRFMESLGGLRELRIILTGAGSSAFIGEALACAVAKSAGIKCEAIHTTDIVSAPDTVLFADMPTLLISFGRSGNSPESAGAVRYARKVVKTLYEVAIVCDGTSQLAVTTAEAEKNLVLVMPDGSNDKGFAMTSSVTCMLLAGFALLNYGKIDAIVGDLSSLCENVKNSSATLAATARQLADGDFDRAIYLGSGTNKALAHEGSLKMMELSNGGVCALYDSAPGFRHGPKTAIKDRTLSLHIISSDPFTARYDVDLLREVFAEKNQNKVVAICADTENIAADAVVTVASGYGFAETLCTGIHSLVFCQMLAMFKSIALGITTDNPSPGGQVNRVVKGVTVYPL